MLSSSSPTSFTSQLACYCARSTAKLSIIFVSAILSLYNQFAIGKIRIIHTLFRYLNILYRDNNRIRSCKISTRHNNLNIILKIIVIRYFIDYAANWNVITWRISIVSFACVGTRISRITVKYYQCIVSSNNLDKYERSIY